MSLIIPEAEALDAKAERIMMEAENEANRLRYEASKIRFAAELYNLNKAATKI
jgi:hypothetical protein